jgi:hypothetical protein
VLKQELYKKNIMEYQSIKENLKWKPESMALGENII